MYIENEGFLSEREYDVYPLKDEHGRPVFKEKTGEQIFISRKIIVNPTEIPNCVDLDINPDFREPDKVTVSQPNILYRKVPERVIEHDENPYDQTRRIMREKQEQRSGYGKQLRRGYID